MLYLPTTVAAILTELPWNRTALSDLMEFDLPITVHDDGTVTNGPPNIYAPSLYDDELDDDRWALMGGYSGQHGYSGPIMHPSEFIGDGMARDILAEPGTYVAIAANYSAEFTYEACGAGSVQCRHCGADIQPDGQGAWVDEDTDGDACPAEPDGSVHEPEDVDADGWAVARLSA